MPFIKIEDFKENKVRIGDMYSTTTPVPYNNLAIKYEYSPNSVDELVIRTPPLNSMGVLPNRGLNDTQPLTGYTLALKISKSEDVSEEERNCYNVLERLTDVIREKLEEKETVSTIKKVKRKGIAVDNLVIFRPKDDTTSTVYLKLYTDKSMNITTPFYKLASKKDIARKVVSKDKPIKPAKALDYVRQGIQVIVGIKIDGVFINSHMESLRIKATEVIVLKKTVSTDSIFSKDLNLQPRETTDSDDDDDDNDHSTISTT